VGLKCKLFQSYFSKCLEKKTGTLGDDRLALLGLCGLQDYLKRFQNDKILNLLYLFFQIESRVEKLEVRP
jgi:hypothetical protein